MNFEVAFESVEIILPLWVLACALLFFLLRGFIRNFLAAIKAVQWRSFNKEERAAATTVEFAMAIPVLILLICFVLDTTFLLMAKMGTVYAAFGTARSVCVWEASLDESSVNDWATSTAIRNMIPFSSGSKTLDRVSADSSSPYLEAYKNYTSEMDAKSASNKYITAKRDYAAKSVIAEVLVEPDPDDSLGEVINVTVTYEYPTPFAVYAKLFGEKGHNGFYVIPVSSTIKLHNELPRNLDKKLGINYASKE